MRKSRAIKAVNKIRGGYGVPAPRKPRSPFFDPRISEDIINRKLKRGPLPPLDKPVTNSERIRKAIDTEVRGRINQFKRHFSDSELRMRAAQRARAAYIMQQQRKRTIETMTKKDNTSSPKTKTDTIPLLDNENGTTVSTKGKMRLDKAYVATKVKVDMSGPVKQRSFYTSFTLGKQTSRSLKEAARLNGKKTVSLFNSLTDTDFKDPTKNHKEYCEMVAGFGQKLLYTSKFLTPIWKNIYSDIYKVTVDTATDTFATNPDAVDSTKDLALYGCALNVNSKITLRNNMNTTSAVVKIHLVALKDKRGNSAPYTETINSLPTSGNMNGIEDQRILSAPAFYPRPYVRNSGTFVAGTVQYGPQTTDSHAMACYVAPGVDIRESERWNDRYLIVKTLSRTLDVGDDWTININRTLGSGLRLDEALRSSSNLSMLGTNQSAVPFGHRIIVEMYGKKIVAEAQYTDTYTGSSAAAIPAQAAVTGEDKYIGTAPCSVSWEAAHYITYVLQSYSGIPASLNETNFNSRVGGPLIRSYERDATVTNVPVNYDYWKTNGNTTYSSPIKIQSATTATVQTVTTTS